MGRDPRPVLLDPHAPTPLSQADRAAAEKGGLLAVDCSWNQLARRGGLPEGTTGRRDSALRRRLPLLLAANPQHFGRLGELNTVEALSAGLYVLGAAEHAARLLEGFRGGPAFLDINRERLDRYADASDADQVVAAERSLFGGA
jgi:pre-rRNA-processing protein TSR3